MREAEQVANQQIQVMMKDGETYDRVGVLGVDERRDVTALHIPLKNAPTLLTRAITDEQIGERVFTLSNPQGMN